MVLTCVLFRVSGYQSTSSEMTFSGSPSVVVEDSMTLTLSWDEVEFASNSLTTMAPSVVYLLLWRTEGSEIWRKAVMTTNLHTSISGAHAQYVDLEFLLTAVDREGVVAEVRPQYPTTGYDVGGEGYWTYSIIPMRNACIKI